MIELRYYVEVWKYVTWNSRNDEWDRHEGKRPSVLQYKSDSGEWINVPTVEVVVKDE